LSWENSCGILTTELAVSMRKAVGFRNILAHDHIEVDDSIVVGKLESLGDLEEFVRQVAVYVTGALPEPGSPRQPRASSGVSIRHTGGQPVPAIGRHLHGSAALSSASSAGLPGSRDAALRMEPSCQPS
jgi:hypothetical protein